MIYITGDCHGNFERFNNSIFPEQEEMTKDDFVIICGDFGGVWHKDVESEQETMILDWLECKPFTTLFVCGNHENFDRLYGYPVEEWNGGNVHRIRPSVIHLMRGQVFTLEGKRIFVRHAEDDRLYLYDIMKIKKETSTLFQSEDLTQ